MKAMKEGDDESFLAPKTKSPAASIPATKQSHEIDRTVDETFTSKEGPPREVATTVRVLDNISEVERETTTETAAPMRHENYSVLANTTIDERKFSKRQKRRERQRQRAQINRTKILGYINAAYAPVGVRWYDRLTALGYTEHVIVAADNLTSEIFARDYPHYRIEHSYRPPLPEKFWNATPDEQLRKEIELIYYQRWLYVLQQLRAGYHILITDVDNIFSSYYPMSDMELSEYDAFHALETKFPPRAFRAMGFVLCGGMAWLRSTRGAMQFVKLLVDRCNGKTLCDDQAKLNFVMAFEMDMIWNLTDWHKSFRTRNNHTALLDGLLEKSFTGVSRKTGHKVKIWDRDFAYRGAIDPEVCPVDNWVSMPFVQTPSLSETGKFKLGSYATWDSFCPNAVSKRTNVTS
jgi:hypothetical protein